MKEQLEQEILLSIMPYMNPEKVEDAKMRIVMAMSGYEVTKRETSLTVYEGDINDEILRRFCMAKIARGCSPRTVKYYRESVTLALNKIGKTYNEITADDIRIYLALRVQRDKVSKTTANNERRNLSAFFTWLQKEEILTKNPMNKVEQIKITKSQKKAFSQMELELIRYNCRTSMESAIVEVLISTWARVSEVVQIRLDEIDGNKVLVHGKGDKDREVFLTSKAQLAVANYLNDRKDENPYLFPKAKFAGDIQSFLKPSKSRAEMSLWYKVPNLVGNGHRDAGTVEATIRNIAKRANVQNAHPHRFRRTGATMALRSGMPLMTVSKLLGHANIGTTQIYLDISDKELEQAHEKYVV